MKTKTCFDCANCKRQTKGGDFIGYSCAAQPGKKWALSTAGKETRCGSKKIWFVAIQGAGK